MAGSQFPKGLRVLLVDEPHSCASIRAQLESPSLQYAVTSVTSAPEALSYLRTGVAAFDVVLAESRIVAGDEAVGRSFVDAFEETPVVLMSCGGSPDDVMRAVKLGAVDFMDKPLSHLKLKNIWQHSVRKMMLKASSGPRPAACVGPSPTATQFASWASLPTGGAASASALSLGAPESPGTPSATSGDLPGTHSAMCCEETSLRSSMELPSVAAPEPGGFVEALTSALGGPAAAHALAPPPLAANPAVAPATWPQLHAGCVWGTPAGGPVPPPGPGSPAPAPAPWAASPQPPALSPAHSAPEPLVLKQCGAAAVLPVAATSDDVIIPEGFFSDASLLGKSATGPLGLQLKKSASLLNLINSTLGSSGDNLSGLAAMMC